MMRWLDTGLVLTVFAVSATVLGMPMPIETTYVPTIVNGVTSSISLIIVFTGILITQSSRKDSGLRSPSAERIIVTITFLGISACLLWSAYFSLVSADFYLALRDCMIGLAISVGTFVDFMLSILPQLPPTR
jgi:hypothetical protein